MQDRYVRMLKAPKIHILDTKTDQQMIMPLQCWKLLIQIEDDIQEAADALTKRREFQPLHRHLGGNVFLSATPGIYCIDLRQYFMPGDAEPNDEPRPTGSGMYRRI